MPQKTPQKAGIAPIKLKQGLGTSTHMNNQHVKVSIDAMCGISARLPTDIHGVRRQRSRTDTPPQIIEPVHSKAQSAFGLGPSLAAGASLEGGFAEEVIYCSIYHMLACNQKHVLDRMKVSKAAAALRHASQALRAV